VSREARNVHDYSTRCSWYCDEKGFGDFTAEPLRTQSKEVSIKRYSELRVLSVSAVKMTLGPVLIVEWKFYETILRDLPVNDVESFSGDWDKSSLRARLLGAPSRSSLIPPSEAVCRRRRHSSW
jgi:hypothetical protein